MLNFRPNMHNHKKKLGLLMLTALVAGNMIGSGVFLLPADLASIGSISILSWIATAIGAFFLAIVFSKMSLLIPKTGGPYAYAKAGFGTFIGFQTAYSYWIAIWIGNAAIAIAMVGYLAVFFPFLDQPLNSFFFAAFAVWVLTFVNAIGVRSAGFLQLVTTILKLIPISLVVVIGWWYFHPEFITQSFNVAHKSNLGAFSNAAALTLWSFIGVESATIPAAATENPERDIPLATLLGTLIAAVVYISSCTAIMGMVPMHILARSTFPFAVAAQVIFGQWGEWIIGAGAAISCFGALNGWILLQGQVPMAAADDNLFPKIFSKRNKAGVPAWGTIITSILITILLFLNSNPDLVKEFQIMILMAILASVIPYLYTSIAELVVLKQQSSMKSKFHTVIAILAGAYSFWIVFSSGEDIIFYSLIIIFISIPLYALLPFKDKQT